MNTFMKNNRQDRNAWDAAVQSKRAEQRANGYTAEHDREHGVEHLLLWAQDYASRGRHLDAAALVEAAREVLFWQRMRPASDADHHDQHHDDPSPVDGTTWVQRTDGWLHVDVLDREVRMRRSAFHGLMVGVDGHWAYVGDAESRMRDYLNTEGDRTAGTMPVPVSVLTVQLPASLPTREQIAEALNRASDEAGAAEASWHELMFIMADAVLALLSQPTPTAEPPRIEDLAPGTTLNIVEQWTVAADTNGEKFIHRPKRFARFVEDVDPSTIRDVTPPKDAA